MGLADITRDGVLRALAEFDQLGRVSFLGKYGFGEAKEYFLEEQGRRYDSKAIVGAAHGFDFPDLGPLKPPDFAGGDATVRPRLEQLGFRVLILPKSHDWSPAPKGGTIDGGLDPGAELSWDDAATRYGFKPGFFAVAGGMIPAKRADAVLLVTHPGGGRSFDYQDYWDGPDLIYGARGKLGDQSLSGLNRDVAENRRTLLVFESAGSKRLRFRGEASCVDYFWSTGPDKLGVSRKVVRFRLRLKSTPAAHTAVAGATTSPHHSTKASAPPTRTPRAFDPSRVPSSISPPESRTSPEELAQLMEKASAAHHQILVRLHLSLERAGWTDIHEIPGAIDLSARRDSRRVIFEAKSIEPGTELSQTRHAIAQLLEYRFFFGEPADDLCLITNAPVSDNRVRFMASIGIEVCWVDGERLCAGSPNARTMLGDVLTHETLEQPQLLAREPQ